MRNDFEIGIVGGGPAGSTAAAYLADYGFEVCLFEKKSFPRETLCGEFLSAEVISVLKEQNLFNEFLSLSPNKINSFRFFNSSGRSIYNRFNFNAYGLSRSTFDNMLLCNVRRKGVNVFQPAMVKEITRLQDSYELLVEGTNEFKVNVKYLIAAYGRQNFLDNSLKRNFINSRSKLNGIKFHLTRDKLNLNYEEIQIFVSDGIYCGVNAVDNNKVTLCFLENRNYNQLPPRKQLVGLQKKNKAFNNLFNSSDGNIFNDLPVYGTGNIYFGRRKKIEDGIFMIGDSAGVIAPLAGDGIGIAMESGRLLSKLFLEKNINELTADQLRYLYEKGWNRLFLKRIKTAMIIQKFMMNKYGREAGFQIVKLFPSLLSLLIESTRNILNENI